MNHYEIACVDTSKTDVSKEETLLELLSKSRLVKTDYNSMSKSICKNCEARKFMNSMRPMEIEKVIFNNPATIVIWSDGTKTGVKCTNEELDKEKGLAMAICKRVLGNKGNYFNEFRKWIEDEKEE